jgi:hypothetical protein
VVDPVEERDWTALLPGDRQGGRARSATVTPLRPVGRRPPSPSVTDASGDELAELYRSVAVLARSMPDEGDLGRFFEGVSTQVGGLIPHDRLLAAYLAEGGRILSVLGGDTRSGLHGHDPCDEVGHAHVLA